MKRLHRDDLFGWSVFDASRNIDFHGLAWVRAGGNVLVDPVAMSAHDQAHLGELGGAATIVVTNSDHTRDAVALAEKFGARLLGPRGEQDGFPIRCDGWLGGNDVDHRRSRARLEGGRLCLLPDAKLGDSDAARASARRLAALPGIEAVIVGDGWPVFRHGAEALRELVESFDGA